ncbi:hypothetical protein H4219_002119 [Mycoemilia scoparia]|uniref:Tyrosinase copper-binding domain-containing protein n=1 Tax=Mycoemilia scoparia TaxID=417184 RepID=A0A9W7ZYH1_9FUNG|nr:hypothetical protein H4219_002119 [Mycoemilia scoparia]
MVERKEIRQLSSRELRAYINGVNKLKENGVIDQLARKHYTNVNNGIHGTAQFLPWHRNFIKVFENELRKIDSSLAAHYWDWTLDAQSPETSILLTEDYFGGNGDPNDGHCLRESIFSTWELEVPKRHCLQRDYRRGDRLPKYWGPEAVAELINDSRTYEEISLGCESNMHGIVHLGFNGKNSRSRTGDMGTMYSPNDPLFYLHHSMIDKIWYDWQLIEEKRFRMYGPSSERKRDTPDMSSRDMLIDIDHMTVADVLDPRKDGMCYTYQDSGSYTAVEVARRAASAYRERERKRGYDVGTPGYSNTTTRPDRSHFNYAIKAISEVLCLKDVNLDLLDDSELKIALPDPVDDQWIEMNCLEKSVIEHYQKAIEKMACDLNEDPFYISPAVVFHASRLQDIKLKNQTKKPKETCEDDIEMQQTGYAIKQERRL